MSIRTSCHPMSYTFRALRPSTSSLPHPTRQRPFTTSPVPRLSSVSETIDNMISKIHASLSQSHPEQSEAVPQSGLRMLVFGKPGSGKVGRPAHLLHPPYLSSAADESRERLVLGKPGCVLRLVGSE